MIVCEPLEGFPAAFHRHVEIEQSNVEAAFSEVLYGFATVFRNDNVVIFGSERRAQRGEHFFVIIGKQHFCFHVCQSGLHAGAVPGERQGTFFLSARSLQKSGADAAAAGDH